jgi:hypothetical protein
LGVAVSRSEPSFSGGRGDGVKGVGSLGEKLVGVKLAVGEASNEGLSVGSWAFEEVECEVVFVDAPPLTIDVIDAELHAASPVSSTKTKPLSIVKRHLLFFIQSSKISNHH